MINNNNQDIVITGLAAVTPVGLNVNQSCASIRADISRFTEHPYYECLGLDPEWDEETPLTSSSVSIIDPFLDGPERLIRLIIPALIDIFSNTNVKRQDLQTGGLMLALPQRDEIIEKFDLEKTFIPELLQRTGLNKFKYSTANQCGHSGMFSLIKEAIPLLISGELDFCVIGGVDSYLMEDRLEFLDKSWRIKSERNVDGFIPGEAATAIFLETDARAKSGNHQMLGTISGHGEGQETHTINSDKNSNGVGLSNAILDTLNQEDESIQWVASDLNGENYRSFEWGIVQTRLQKIFSETKEICHPADCVGDIGAATGGLLIASVVRAFQRGYNVSEKALLWTSSDDGHRAALAINQCSNE